MSFSVDFGKFILSLVKKSFSLDEIPDIVIYEHFWLSLLSKFSSALDKLIALIDQTACSVKQSLMSQ